MLNKKPLIQIFILFSLIVALFIIPTAATAEDKPAETAKSDSLLKPSSGLDFLPDESESKNAQTFSLSHMPLNDTTDLSLHFGKTPRLDITSKKESTDRRALLGFIFRF